MRKVLIIVALGILFASLVSAEVIITQEPADNYNLGETVTIPITVKSLTEISSVINMNLICGGNEINFYKNGVGLSAGEEKKMTPSLVLTHTMINGLKGTCVIKAQLDESYVLTREFTITDTINIEATTDPATINPGESVVIEGNAAKLSGNTVNGFIELAVYAENSNANTTPVLSKIETINNGYFLANFSTQDSIAAGNYKVVLRAYEKDPNGEITNQGSTTIYFLVNQISTNLEVVIEDPVVSPGSPLLAKAILHDQTGENIESEATIKIKSPKDKLLDKIELMTGEEFEFPTLYNQVPGQYKIEIKSQGIENTKEFIVTEKKDVKIQVLNRTLIVKNIGNVPYCEKTILVKIGNQALNIDACIEVDDEQKFTLSAPDGNYEVEIITDESEFKESAILTGKTIEIQKAARGVATLSRFPLVWLFVIAIMGFVAFTIFKKGLKRSFIGYVHKKKNSTKPQKVKEEKVISNIKEIFNSDKAELCLSIKGEKQNATILGLKIKNYKEVKKNLEGVRDTIGKISSLIRENKAAVYENQENIFILFAPIKTKTFKNDRPALDMAQKIKNILSHHNKLFKQKIEFGLSLNTGTIIAKMQIEKLQFMSMGDLMTKSKKIAGLSKETILLGEKIREKFGNAIKVEKFTKDKVPIFAIREIKSSQDNEKFISSFLNRIDKK